MQIKITDRDDVKLCCIDGEIDLNTSPQLKKEFEKVAGAKAKKVLINFSSVTYVDSSGLATIVEIFKKLKSYGGALKLSNLSPKVKNLFEITKLEKLFDIQDDEEEAIKSFS